MAKEILDIVDDNGQPTGEVIDRVTAHREGILHRTSHVWLVRMKDSRLQVLLQKRRRAGSGSTGRRSGVLWSEKVSFRRDLPWRAVQR